MARIKIPTRKYNRSAVPEESEYRGLGENEIEWLRKFNGEWTGQKIEPESLHPTIQAKVLYHERYIRFMDALAFPAQELVENREPSFNPLEAIVETIDSYARLQKIRGILRRKKD